MVHSFGIPFGIAAILKLCHDICQFIGPIMLEKVIDFLEDDSPAVATLKFYLFLGKRLHVCDHHVCCRSIPEHIPSKLLLPLLSDWITLAF